MKYIFLVLIFALIAGCYARIPERTGLEGKPIPHYTILFADSITYFNTEHISKGSPTVFIYFGPHCIYSRSQTEELVGYFDKMKNVNFYFITTSSIGEIKEFVKEFKLNEFPNVMVGNDYTHFFQQYYEAVGVPFIAIYGKDGELSTAFQGRVSPKQIKNCIQG